MTLTLNGGDHYLASATNALSPQAIIYSYYSFAADEVAPHGGPVAGGTRVLVRGTFPGNFGGVLCAWVAPTSSTGDSTENEAGTSAAVGLSAADTNTVVGSRLDDTTLACVAPAANESERTADWPLLAREVRVTLNGQFSAAEGAASTGAPSFRYYDPAGAATISTVYPRGGPAEVSLIALLPSMGMASSLAPSTNGRAGSRSRCAAASSTLAGRFASSATRPKRSRCHAP